MYTLFPFLRFTFLEIEIYRIGFTKNAICYTLHFIKNIKCYYNLNLH